ncbi:MAG: tail-specific protease [Gammaproteobacteria bacterium]|nr:tail-specific protease [Gammaproteobacteria bacterium]
MPQKFTNRALFLSLLLIVALGIPLASIAKTNPSSPQAEGYDLISPNREYSAITREVIGQLQRKHYLQTAVDDKVASATLDRYLKALDSSRMYFLGSDINAFEPYRTQLDDMLKRGDLQAAFGIFNRYQEYVIERLQWIVSRLDKGLEKIDFKREETLETDREDAPWAKSQADLDELWRKRLKNAVLELKLSDKSLDEIQELLTKRYKNQLNRARQINAQDVFQIFMNAFTHTYDPHTQYFSPRLSENFNINMSLSLEGIGALLQTENEYTKVVRLIPAGPAEKAKQLKPADRIVGVGQGKDGEIVDVVGWRLDEVVELIRGPKGTTVRLDIIPVDAVDDHQTRVLSIVRNTVKLEEQAAQKRVIEIKHGDRSYKIGVIHVPAFYIDFDALQRGERDYRSTTRDVRKLLEALIAESVDGVVIDLRNNGGGSLRESNTLTGLFIDKGPTVQVRSGNGYLERLMDPDPGLVYDGPLAVLVNRLSASASEIFAGAIQDYQRGIVIGGQTFGKGTVQSLIPLDQGQLKLTLAKFYRVSGTSTQHQGVLPDIAYPVLFDTEEIGESALEGALKWDRIRPLRYRRYGDLAPYLDQVRVRHLARIKNSPDFNYLDEQIHHLDEIRNKNVVSLNEAKRKQERADSDAWRLRIENKRRVAKSESRFKDIKALREFEEAEVEKAKSSANTRDEENDFLVEESGHILLDMLALSGKHGTQTAVAAQ